VSAKMTKNNMTGETVINLIKNDTKGILYHFSFTLQKSVNIGVLPLE
jgi:hypothetical protein